MGFKAVNCPSCGASVELDSIREFGFCTYCGTKIVQDKIIHEHRGSVTIEGTANVASLSERARIMLSDGDTVIVRKQSDADTNDDVIAFVNGNDATFKRLQKTDKGIRLKAINPAYDSYFYNNEQIKNLPISILGVVVEMRRTRK